jgi:anti-sigma regulatory factor (Ser/Thr protein kinase)
MAQQVAHDIRSPLTALNIAVSALNGLSDEPRNLIRSAVQRITKIANDLARKTIREKEGALDEGKPSVQHIATLVEAIVLEKRFQYLGRSKVQFDLQLDHAARSVFAEVEPTSFQRVLSNIIDNAAEASSDGGNIQIHVNPSQDRFTLIIEDSGKGIPEDVLPKLMRQGATFGKPNGNGLGLFHAQKTFQCWNGSIKIDSKVGKGTSVFLHLPSNSRPDWFAAELHLDHSVGVAILDDDESIEQAWKARLLSLGMREDRIYYFNKPEKFTHWFQEEHFKGSPLLLCDFELVGSRQTGLDLIEQLATEANSILVTSRFQDGDLINRCSRLGVPILPKCCIASVPILIVKGCSRATRV